MTLAPCGVNGWVSIGSVNGLSLILGQAINWIDGSYYKHDNWENFQLASSQGTPIFLWEYAFQSLVCKMAAILFKPQFVDLFLPWIIRKLHYKQKHSGHCLHWKHWKVFYIITMMTDNSRPISQLPQCTCPIYHNTPCRREMCAFLYWMVYCGICDRGNVGYMRAVYWLNTEFTLKRRHVTLYITCATKT